MHIVKTRLKSSDRLFHQNLLGICPCDSAMQLLRLGRGTPRVAHSCAQEWGDVYYIPWSVHIGPTAALSLCNPKSPCLRMAIPRPLQSLSLPLLGDLERPHGQLRPTNPAPRLHSWSACLFLSISPMNRPKLEGFTLYKNKI